MGRGEGRGEREQSARTGSERVRLVARAPARPASSQTLPTCTCAPPSRLPPLSSARQRRGRAVPRQCVCVCVCACARAARACVCVRGEISDAALQVMRVVRVVRSSKGSEERECRGRCLRLVEAGEDAAQVVRLERRLDALLGRVALGHLLDQRRALRGEG